MKIVRCDYSLRSHFEFCLTGYQVEMVLFRSCGTTKTDLGPNNLEVLVATFA